MKKNQEALQLPGFIIGKMAESEGVKAPVVHTSIRFEQYSIKLMPSINIYGIL